MKLLLGIASWACIAFAHPHSRPSTMIKTMDPMVPCAAGDLVLIDCNLCTCNKQGFPNQMCARMWCPVVPTEAPPPPTLPTPPPTPPTPSAGDEELQNHL